MANEDGSVWVTYNGEIYNHVHVRRQLEQRGHRFRTQSDTEVLVHGFEEWGPAVLERLNGIYAFALLDCRHASPTLTLARDPMGVKPLYVGCSGAQWWFASELAAARDCGLFGHSLRTDAFAEYLLYRFVPSPGTFYRNAWKVPPGHFCVLDCAWLPESPTFHRFSISLSSVLPSNQRGWEEALSQGLVDSTQRQLMSDVPVGSLLSGGVDSTVITQAMTSALPQPPTAFAIGFAASRTNELVAARQSAQAIGVPLKEISLEEDAYLAEWPRQAATLGEPIANSSALMVGILCRVVRETHKVVLTGQGADEPLGGYPRHVSERWYPLLSGLKRAMHLVPERWLADDRVGRLRRIVGERDVATRFAETLAVFGLKDLGRLCRHGVNADTLVDPVRRWMPDTDDLVNQLLVVDARLSLADDLLIVADHMSMASSVELRVPFLDLEYVSQVERMPSRYKISALGERKWLYRRAIRGALPSELRTQMTGWRGRTGRKLGFTTPLDRWAAAWLRNDAEGFLTGAGSRLPDFLSAEAVATLVRGARDEGWPRNRQLSSLFVLETWLRGALPA
jgi:asparagine synthase (glutamine-hydrolysing)